MHFETNFFLMPTKMLLMVNHISGVELKYRPFGGCMALSSVVAVVLPVAGSVVPLSSDTELRCW
jgi:hypothetical protein